MMQLKHPDKPFVVLENISKSFKDVKALEDINISIAEGQIVTLAGPDAAGKTTLIRLIAGLFLPDTGSVTIGGYNTLTEAQEISNFIGYMPQRFGLYEDLTVIQNLNLYADLKGLSGQERMESFERLLSFTNLSPFKNRLAGNLSGGMKQKLGLACSLLKKPKLLLLDEPTVGVDPISRRELWKIVQDLISEGITVIWSTSYLDEAERTPMTLLLNEGKLLYQGPPEKLTERVQGKVYKIENIQENRREVLRRALNEKDILDGTIQGSDVRIVTKEKTTIDLNRITRAGAPTITPTEPHYEDAFVDVLGGVHTGGTSKLAEALPEIPKRDQPVVEAKNLTKEFGSFVAASDISFTVRQGEIFGLLGPNGAGKTTTFKMLCGLLKPTKGSARVLGYDLQTERGEALSRIGYMAQKFSLYGDLGLKQNLDFFAGVYGLYGKTRKKLIDRMIDVFNFAPYLNESARNLPLGYKQRLSLACAVMHHPEVLFLDEPTSGVDPITRREFWTHMNGMVEKGITIIVTTHFMDEAEYCDRIGLIYQGKLIEIGSPDRLKNLSKSEKNPKPTLEDAFIYLINNYDKRSDKS